MCAGERRWRRGGLGVPHPSRLLSSSRSSPVALPMPPQLSLRSLLCHLRSLEHPREEENSPTLLPGSHRSPTFCAVSMEVLNIEVQLCRLGGQERGDDGRCPEKFCSLEAWLKPNDSHHSSLLSREGEINERWVGSRGTVGKPLPQTRARLGPFMLAKHAESMQLFCVSCQVWLPPQTKPRVIPSAAPPAPAPVQHPSPGAGPRVSPQHGRPPSAAPQAAPALLRDLFWLLLFI